MTTYRIIKIRTKLNEIYYKVQRRYCWFFWETETQNVGGYAHKIFPDIESAEEYINSLVEYKEEVKRIIK